MPILVDLLRPDDLLNLRVEAINLKLEVSDPHHPALVPEDATQPSYLAIHFPPQTIVEEAFYQSSKLLPPPEEQDFKTHPYNKPPKPPSAPEPTGVARARIGGPSRLVFQIPADPATRIPYSLAGLLNWAQLTLNVSPLADVPVDPTDAQRAQAPDIQKPQPLETAIEMPYRLLFSPAHDVVWDHATQLKTHAGHTELWHTRLAYRDAQGKVVHFSRVNPVPLRVLWSPDYNSHKFKSDPPNMGVPDLDWDNPPPGVLTAMTPSDRHEIVVLTSAFHGFIKGLKDNPTSYDYTDFVPTPIHAEQVILSPLGGWLTLRGNWRPPMPYKPPRIVLNPGHKRWDEIFKAIKQIERLPRLDLVDLAAESAAERAPVDNALAVTPAQDFLAAKAIRVSELWPQAVLGEVGDSLNISEWKHVATQGRDHYVQIVYEGFLYYPRHRAALVKVTERKISNGKNGSPVAYLTQRMFIVVRQPLMDYSQERDGDKKYGRAMPLNRIRLTTLITPDIDMPASIAGKYSFWVKVGGEPFKFHAVGEDMSGNQIDFTTALIFVPFSDVTNNITVAKVRDEYLKHVDPKTKAYWRANAVPGQQVTFAERKGDNSPDNTTLTTRVLHFTTDGAENSGYLFRPVLFKAEVNLPAVEQILGTTAPTQIAYYQNYLDKGLADADNPTGLFANITKEVSAGDLKIDKIAATFSADKAGGITTPNLSISGLTRELGPVAGDQLDALAANKFDPSDFFKDVKNTAKIFGSISLLDLLPGGSLGKNAPHVQFFKEDIPARPNAKKLVAKLDWTPEVQSASFGIVHLNVNANTVLKIQGRTEQVIELPPPLKPEEAHALFEGSLTNFTIDFLNVIAVPFQEFHFKSETGSKSSVDVNLGGQPEFEGDLKFVNKLREIIPPGLFGDGASLDLTPQYVKVGFDIGLPPLAVGVFALQNLSLGAALTLPFLDGMPLFDFHISSREHPFNLTVAFLGGGGFFHLQVATDGLRQLEVALEFGASASINLGVASGGVHIMAGIYFAMGKKDGKDYAVLSGYLRMGGELSVLGLISISLEFYLSFSYEDGKAAGRATLTVKVEVVCFSKSVDITVEKKFGGSSGDPKFFQVFETPMVWDTYASAFA